jgi:hypothetical protein
MKRTLCLLSILVACKGPVPPASTVADDVKVDVVSACTTITAVSQDVVATLACATAEEVATLASLITHQIGLAVIGDGGLQLSCISAHGRTVCSTPAQMVDAIKTMNARRIYGTHDGGR